MTTTATHIPDGVRQAIEQALQLRHASPEGKELRFLAPCHDDQDPSARWNRDKATWYCDVCKKGGGYRNLAGLLGVSIPTARNGSAKQVECAYDYVTASGDLLFQTVRFKILKNGKPSKTFAQRRPDGTGGWIWNLNGIELVLYRLDRLTGEVRVYLVEGEKDADRCWSLGIPATCNPMGAGKWTDAYTQQLIEAGVHEGIVLPDNDKPGREHAESVARSCVAAGLVAKIIALPSLPPKGDVSDFLDAGGTVEQLCALVKAAPSWVPETPEQASPQTVGEPSSFHLTDVGNGQLFAQHHLSYIRYCYPHKSWFVCNETTLWERDPGHRVLQLAKETIRSIYDEARHETNDERRTKLAAHAVKSEHAQRLHAMLDLARSEAGIAISPDAFDTDPWVFNVVNGVLDLKTGVCRERQRGDLISKQSPVTFDSTAHCPTWLHFLTRIFRDDQRLLHYVQQIAGYCLTGLTVEQVFFLLWGSGSNGKSTLLKVILKLFGDYGLQVPADTFLSRTQDGRATPDLARLQGARLAVAIESDEGCRLAEGTLKQMTGGDRIAARRLYQDFVEFEPTHKILFATNHKPRVKDNTHAMWRRMRLIPFEVQIADHEQDPAMADKLLLELPGILNWALAGCLAWQQAGRLHAPEPVVAATQAYREEQDILDDFLHERTVLGPDESVRFSELRQEYVAWSKEASDKVMSSKAFAAALSERGYLPVRRSNARFYRGLRLRSVADVDVQMPVATTQGSVDVDLDA